MPAKVIDLEKGARSDSLINAAQEGGGAKNTVGLSKKELFEGKFSTRNIFLHYFTFLC